MELFDKVQPGVHAEILKLHFNVIEYHMINWLFLNSYKLPKIIFSSAIFNLCNTKKSWLTQLPDWLPAAKG